MPNDTKQRQGPGNYLKNAEMSVEGNYNQIDGILGNAPGCAADLTDGQTYDELRELAPETLPEEKQSILDRLEKMREQAEAQPGPFPTDGYEMGDREL